MVCVTCLGPLQVQLARLGLDGLYRSRVKADLIMRYEILNNLVCVVFMLSSTCHRRGISMKLNKWHIASVRDGHIFTNPVITLLNSLSDHIVTSPKDSNRVICVHRYIMF